LDILYGRTEQWQRLILFVIKIWKTYSGKGDRYSNFNVMLGFMDNYERQVLKYVRKMSYAYLG
jgi:hypothetical protein